MSDLKELNQTASGVTRSLSQGERLSWRGTTGHQW